MEPSDMRLPSPREMADEFGIVARRRLGQCFLANGRTLGKIVAAARLDPETAVIEVGAGPGYLTARILRRTPHVWAIECDERFRAVHERYFAPLESPPRFVYGDALRLDWPDLLAQVGERPYIVMGNIPFQITSPLLEVILNLSPLPKRSVLLVQSEFAERLAAQTGRRAYGALTVKTSLLATVRQAVFVPRQRFTPRPRVDSAAIAIEPRKKALIEPEARAAVFAVVDACFTQPRKKIVNSLLNSRYLGDDRETIRALLTEATIAPERRPQTLTAEEFVRLAEGVERHKAAVRGVGQPS